MEGTVSFVISNTEFYGRYSMENDPSTTVYDTVSGSVTNHPSICRVGRENIFVLEHVWVILSTDTESLDQTPREDRHRRAVAWSKNGAWNADISCSMNCDLWTVFPCGLSLPQHSANSDCVIYVYRWEALLVSDCWSGFCGTRTFSHQWMSNAHPKWFLLSLRIISGGRWSRTPHWFRD